VNSLLRSIADRWSENATLCGLVPFSRVCTVRITQTELYRFPYVSILTSTGSPLFRTDKTRASAGPVTFHVWVDDDHLEYALDVAAAITEAYADTCWSLGGGSKVFDVGDGGEPLSVQVDLPTVKAWEVVKVMTFYVERNRVDTGTCFNASSDGSISWDDGGS